MQVAESDVVILRNVLTTFFHIFAFWRCYMRGLRVFFRKTKIKAVQELRYEF